MDASTEKYLLKQQLAQHRIWLGEAQLYILQLEMELERLNAQLAEPREPVAEADSGQP